MSNILPVVIYSEIVGDTSVVEGFVPTDTTKSLPAADVTANTQGASLMTKVEMRVTRPKTDETEFMVLVRASILTKARKGLAELSKVGFPWSELLLAVCTLSLGGWISWLTASRPTTPLPGAVIMISLPTIAVGTGVAYLFVRTREVDSNRQTANTILSDLPDPQSTSDVMEGKK